MSDLLTTSEACAYLRIHRDTLRRMHLPCVYVGARKRYRRSDLDRQIKRAPRTIGEEKKAS